MGTAPAQPALDAGNDVFHDSYGKARDRVRHDLSILVALPNEVVLRSQRVRQAFPYCGPSFDQAKSAAHIAVALFTLTRNSSLDGRSRTQLSRMPEHIGSALEQLGPPGDHAITEEIRGLLELCLRFGRDACAGALSECAQAEFAKEAGARILSITELATSEQIARLHAAVDLALGKLSTEERDALQVIVVGDHQARTRSLGMQYFQSRFREKPGADERVTYGENISTEEEALALAGTRHLDKVIAHAFFGDEKRLQRDVLGDAAKRCLEQMKF